MDRTIQLLLVIAFIFLGACGEESNSEPESLEGVWTSVEREDATSRMTATIRANTMTIHHVNDEDGVELLYWVGTVPELVEHGTTFLSEGDHEAMEFAIFASLLEEKEFTFKDGEIQFTRGLMGVSWDVRLRRFQ